ncbi:MAG: ABC-2 family transporter protein, partial [candidate division KSB1 bacterium]|nr:ABC-2 family transporter protein [candidate division KSB1 bacterium]
LITFPFMLLVAIVLMLLFQPEFHFHWWAVAVAIPTLLLTFWVRFLLEWTLANAAFWTTRVSAINQTYFVMVLFLSGQMAPLSLFPEAIQWLAKLLPFRWLIGFPVELLLGRLSLGQAVIGWGALVGWLLVALVLLRRVWRAGVRNYSAVGA